jgi:hypothetical protein
MPLALYFFASRMLTYLSAVDVVILLLYFAIALFIGFNRFRPGSSSVVVEYWHSLEMTLSSASTGTYTAAAAHQNRKQLDTE